MFGYVQPDKPQLRLWEYEQYRAVYCGLCRSMGRHTGTLSRLALNYDYVFLAMIRSAMLGIEPDIVPSVCALHPLKKRAIAKDDEALEYCAKVSILLLYHKLRDDIADSRAAKRLATMAAQPLCAIPLARCKEISALGDTIAGLLGEMAELEKKSDISADELAEVFGSIMSEIFAYGLEDAAKIRVARELGRHTGRYIYYADALDDIERDIKNNEFNPFVSMYGKDVYKNTDRIKTAVILELRQLEAALALVDFSSCPGYLNIINNIIYLGMPGKIDKICEKMKQAEN